MVVASAVAAARGDDALVENVDVRLVQVRVLAVDAAGRAVTDLRPDEFDVREGRAPRRLAFAERVLDGAQDPLWALDAPPATALHRAGDRPGGGAPVPAGTPPPPARRIVLAFDVRNSRVAVRERWRAAARDWLDRGLRDGDRVSVVLFRNYADWLVPSSSERALLGAAVDNVTATADAPDRDRAAEMNSFLALLRTNCEAQASRRAAADLDCADKLARPVAAGWELEARETLGNLRQLVGELSAVPGVKMVLLFSEGIVPAAGDAVFTAMQSVLGPDKVPMARQWTIRGDVTRELTAITAAARAAGVTLQLIDSRTARGASGVGDDLEFGSALGHNLTGMDPVGELYAATRGALATLAHETGGRYFAGGRDLATTLAEAADAYDGLYAVGWYRARGDAPGRLRVRITRRGVRATVPAQADGARARAAPLRLDIAVGTPDHAPDDRLAVPVALVFPLSGLPLRHGEGGTHGCVLGVFVQAVREDGMVAAETFEFATAATSRPREAWGTTYFRHPVRLLVPPGSYRIRARVADDTDAVLGDRIVALRVAREGTIR